MTPREPQAAMGRRGQRHRNVAKTCGTQTIGFRVSAHRLLDEACFLKHDAEIEGCFRMIALELDRLAIGSGRTGMIAQILPDKAEVEPDGRGDFRLRGAFQKFCRKRDLAILPCEPAEPCSRLDVIRNGVQYRFPGLPGLRPNAGLIERSRFFDKNLALRGERDHTIQMRQSAVEIPGRSRETRGKQPRGRIVRPFCEAGLDVRPRCLGLARGKQHGCQ